MNWKKLLAGTILGTLAAALFILFFVILFPVGELMICLAGFALTIAWAIYTLLDDDWGSDPR